MILRSSNIKAALRAKQRGFILNPYTYAVGNNDPFWANVVLLMAMDGANNGTSFTDLKAGKTVTRNGAPVTSTAQVKYGTASAFFPNSVNNYLSLADSADWNFGSADWTIEFDGYGLDNLEASSGIVIGQADGLGANAASWAISTEGTFLGFNASTGTGSWNIAAVSAIGVNPNAAAWKHYAVCRQSLTLRIYVDGVQINSGAITTSMPDSTRALTIARGTNTGNSLTGYIDNLRITKGVCRYPNGATFTPPTAAHPTS